MLNAIHSITDPLYKLLSLFSKHMEKIDRHPKEDTLFALENAEKQWNYGEIFKAPAGKYWKTLHTGEIGADSGSPTFLVPEEIKKALDNKVTADKLVEYVNPSIFSKDLERVGAYFKKIGIVGASTTFLDERLDKDTLKNADRVNLNQCYTAMTADGTSRLFQYSLSQLLVNPGDAIIVPTPTYGLFIKPIIEQGGSIIELPLKKENDYKVKDQQLDVLIKQHNKKFIDDFILQLNWLKKKIAKLKEQTYKATFIKSLEAKISDLVKQASAKKLEPTKIAELTERINKALNDKIIALPHKSEKLSRLALRPLRRVRAFLNINPNMPFGKIASQQEINSLANVLAPHSDLNVIDDLTYYDLVLSNATLPGTFAKSKMSERTISFYGMSKQFGLPCLRSAIAIGSNPLLQPMITQGFHHSPTVNLYSDTALKALFDLEDEKRLKYLKDINENYAQRRDLAIAVFKGIKSIPDPSRQKKIIEMLKKNDITEKHVETLLKGVSGLDIITVPDSGFFVVLDLKKYQHHYLGTTQLNSSLDFHLAFKHLLNIESIPMELCFDNQFCGLRFTYGISIQDIAEAALRISHLLKQLSPSPVNYVLAKKAKPLDKNNKSKNGLQWMYQKRAKGKRAASKAMSDDYVWHVPTVK